MVAKQAHRPRFDVVMPLYNKQAYVETAIRSVLAQGAWLDELIVVDDGSTDDGAGIVARLAREYPAIRLLRQANGGVSAARNRGVLASTADYVAFLDADDLYLPGFLKQIAALAARYPEAGLVGTAYRRFSGDAAHALAQGEPDDSWEGGQVPDFFSKWSRGSFITTSSIAVRRQALLDLGGLFPVGERLGEDQDVWFRLAERYPVAYSPRQLALYRVDVGGSLTASTALTGVLPCYARLAERLARGDYPARQRRGARRLLGSHYLNMTRQHAALGDMAGAWRLLADRLARGNPLYWLRTATWLAWRTLTRPQARTGTKA
ncbi:MAG: glycosyltransferase family 2 protein [Thiobacillus sp.]